MSGERASGPDWTVVDEGWGRKAVDFATLSEPANCQEYVAVHHMLGVDNGDRLLDVACGAGLAIELASVRGADCAGIDASARLVAVARDRSPRADIRVGDMHALPWDDREFNGGDELPRDLGNYSGRAGGGLAGAAPWWPRLPDGLGSSQGLAGRLGAHPVPAGSGAQGGQPGRDGSPRPSWPG
jgi:SAM-dependent methyltransferase